MKDEALKLALGALETELAVDMTNGAEVGEAAELMCEAITAIKQAFAAPVQEPVTTVTSESGNPDVTMSWWHEPPLPVGTKLYTTPPAAQPAPVQEPVEFFDWYDNAHWGNEDFKEGCHRSWNAAIKYTTPPAAQPAVPLTDEQIDALRNQYPPSAGIDFDVRCREFARAILAAAQPAVPDAITDDSESPEYRTGWNDCRAEMLKGMK